MKADEIPPIGSYNIELNISDKISHQKGTSFVKGERFKKKID